MTKEGTSEAAVKMSDNVYCGRETATIAEDRSWQGFFRGAYEGEDQRDINGAPLRDVVALCDGCFGGLIRAARAAGDEETGRRLLDEQTGEFSLGRWGELEGVARPCLVCCTQGPKVGYTARRVGDALVERALAAHGERAGIVAPRPDPDDERGASEGGPPVDPEGARSEGAARPLGLDADAGLEAPSGRPVELPEPDWRLLLLAAERLEQRVDWLRAVLSAAARGEIAEWAPLRSHLSAVEAMRASVEAIATNELFMSGVLR